MDLQLQGRSAIVCASSQGLGYACALALAQEGCTVFINGRQAEKLEQAAQSIREASSSPVTAVVADLNTEQGRARLLAACPEPDILINNNAGPAPGQLADWDHDTWLNALESNLISAAMLLRAVLPGMRERGFGRVVNITSAMVKTPHAPMGLSTAARAGLTALSKALSREAIADNVTINNLLPERFDTPRQEFMMQQLMRKEGLGYDQAKQRLAESLPARRFGRPEEFGATCAFLCSAKAGFMTGQNIQLDGGSYWGLV
jgi:3-oxoacyl-[acyl-carrier protein] reductase